MTEHKDLASTPLQDICVVGIGASAGGLEALKALLSKLIPSDRYCVVVAQHLSPKHSSRLTQLLARESQLQVVEARDGLRINGGHVYVTPPHADMEVRDGVLCLDTADRKGPRPSVDMLFRSLAREYQDRAVAVVLSGIGRDGAVGVVAVKSSHGRVVVQDRETAKYNGMPQAALKTGCVDSVLPPGQIAIALNAILEERANGIEPFPDRADEVALVLRKVQVRTNVDFTGSKQGTVLRRLRSRMGAVEARTLSEYLRLLEEDSGEVEELCRWILDQVSIEEELLKQFAPPSVLVDAQLNVKQTFGQVNRFLSIVPGRADLNLTTLLPRELRAIVRAQVRQVQRTGRVEHGVTRQVKLAGGDTCNMQVSVAPAGDPQAEEARFLTSFVEMPAGSTALESLVRSKQRQQDLADQYEMTLDCMEAHVAVLNSQGEIISVNQQWCRFARDNQLLDASCGVGTNYIDLCLQVTGSEAALFRDVARGIRGVLCGDLPQFVFEYPCHAPETKRWFRCIVTPLKSAEGGAVMMHLNVTDRVTVEHQLLLQVAAQESVPTAVFITNAAREIQWVNAAFTRMMGYGLSEVVGRTPDLLRAHRQDAALWEGLWRTVEEGSLSRGEVIHKHRDGNLVTVQQTITPIKLDDHRTTCYVVTAEDITGRKEAEWRILHMAQHDSLTGLPNRTLFNERLRQSIEWADRRNRKVALILLNLDRFKDTNDTLGHQVGDALLVAVARRLETRIRALEVLAGMGGDEFAIYTEDTASHEMIADAASRVWGAFQEPFVVNDQTINVTASLGIAVHPDDSVSVEGLFRAADLAMCKVKGTQRNAYRFYDAETDRETSERVRLAHDLRASFTTGGLWMAMQPQVSLFNGQLVAAEALLRWNTNDWEGVTPARLISVAEESGIIHALGDWVLAEVCGMMRHWQDAGLPPMRFGVNLSAMQLSADKTADNMLAALARRSIEPRCLQVEITESVLLQHSERVRNNIRQLHEAGIGLVLDDFGTGYSSLTYLRQFPVQSLKIDLSFVQGVGTNRSDEQIIAALIDLAHALGIQVCAEGVETAEQVEFLRSRGCDLAQGYYFCRPVTLDQLQDLLAAGTAWGAKLAQAARVRAAAATDG